MSSLLPLLAIGGIWYYLTLRGSATQTIWLVLNVLDTLKALRVIRPNGRRIGINTRKKVMRESLICWTIYILAQTIGPIISILLGWIPFYHPVKAVLCVGFLSMRIAASSHLFQLLIPAIKPYEAPIDLTVLLIQSLGVLLFHYVLQVPFTLVIAAILQSRKSAISSFHGMIKLLKSPPSIVEERIPDDRPTVDEDHIRASFLSPPPQIPGSILLRYPSSRSLTPRRSISFISPPATPKILPPSPSSSESDEIQVIAGPSKPRRPVQNTVDLLSVVQEAEVRRSPRRQKKSEIQDDEIEGIDSIRNQQKAERRKPIGPRFIAAKDSPVVVTSSVRKGKGKAVPVLIIPDEDDEEEDTIPITVHGTTGRSRIPTQSSSYTDKINTLAHPTVKPSDNSIKSGSRLIPRTNSTNLPNTSSDVSKRLAPVQNVQRSIPTSRSISNLNSRIPSKSSSSIDSTLEIKRTKTTTSTAVRSNTTTISKPKPQPKPKPKPKTPRKTKILKASEGGVAHDKPISTAASRSKNITKTRSRAKSKTVELEDEKEDLGKKAGEKRRVVTTGGEVRETRKRVRKE